MPTQRRGRGAVRDLSYGQLEKRLVLLAWLNQRFGFLTNEDALAEAKEAAEGFNADGRSNLSVRLETRETMQIAPPTLARYDNNLRDHLRAINMRRTVPITLRYFQYLAALYAEVYLDWFFNRPGALLDALNRFELVRSTDSRLRDVRTDLEYTRDDLRKLAFWIATGGGKTLLLHLNYHQFLRYNATRQPLDSILLITPNEGLSEQHLAEMTASAIPCRRFDLHESGLHGDSDAVRVIEITKLTEVKKGGGLSVPVEAFEGNNLIFVDEGHKGSGGERWRSYRDALAETGFTFEYSATFGQALTAARNEELTREYAKAIAFDYSYRYFHRDGFGKDFNILNLKDDSGLGLSIVGAPAPPAEESAEERTDRLLLGNLLAFYEQQRVFAEHESALRPYNLARPLWVFVGGTVNAVYSRNKRRQSDVLTVADIRAVFEAADPPCHELVAEDELAEPTTLAGVGALSEAALALAKKYMDRFYRTQEERWTSRHMRYHEVRETDANFQGYVVRVPRAGGAETAEQDAKLLADIERLIEDGQRIYARETAELPNIHFDRHLYQPLLVQHTAKTTSKPPALNDSERRFVEDLRDYCRQERAGALADRELFLLRNQGRGHGVGFFERRSFYPDFILWVKSANAQRIVFVEPHGMMHAAAYVHDDKARLHEKLHELEAEMAANHAGSGKVALDAYIVSATRFENLKPKYDNGMWSMERFAERHILFPVRTDEYDYLALLLTESAADVG